MPVEPPTNAFDESLESDDVAVPLPPLTTKVFTVPASTRVIAGKIETPGPTVTSIVAVLPKE